MTWFVLGSYTPVPVPLTLSLTMTKVNPHNDESESLTMTNMNACLSRNLPCMYAMPDTPVLQCTMTCYLNCFDTMSDFIWFYLILSDFVWFYLILYKTMFSLFITKVFNLRISEMKHFLLNWNWIHLMSIASCYSLNN